MHLSRCLVVLVFPSNRLEHEHFSQRFLFRNVSATCLLSPLTACCVGNLIAVSLPENENGDMLEERHQQ